MARHRTNSIEFKRQVAQAYVGGETPGERHDPSPNLIVRPYVRLQG